ncbi:MAG: pyridoxal phosphate-dependent aminotransferase [Bacteroidetes bacterium]|nr:pyridoxal phosphate-dependent aminotransferase [Bacteroidota bacterium]
MHFSSRIPDGITENAIARRLRTLRAEGVELLDLTEANPARAGLAHPDETLYAALTSASSCFYEPLPRGLPATREAIVGYYAADGISVDPEHLHCTASSSEAYSMLFKLLCDAGDGVCIPQPSYPLFSWLAALDAITIQPYRLRYGSDDTWSIDMTSLEMALDNRTRAVIIVNPSNPAGNYLRSDEFRILDSLCARRGIALIIDEVFWDYPLNNGSQAGGCALRQRSAGAEGICLRFTINGLSKSLGLPQMKLGWILSEGEARTRDAALARLDIIADSYLTVSTPVMHAAATLLARRPLMQNAIRERCICNLRQAMKILGPAILPVSGGWNAVVALPENTDEEAAAEILLRTRHVYLHPGDLFDFSDGRYFVISLLPDPQLFRRAMQRLLAFLSGLE